MADSQIEEVKNKLNIIDVVGSYIKLTKTGTNYRGVCPFHSEKKPSFFVSPTRQMFKCFGCGAGSSMFDFVMKIEGIEFGDALKILASKAGVELKKENLKLRTERQHLYEICNLACSFFEKQLGNSAWGKQAKEYLVKRGIKEESIKKWRLGYSPDTWQGLSDFLVGKGYKREEVLRAGLAVNPVRNEISNGVKSESIGRSYDRFRGRIIFPIFDLNSQVVGFGGRVFKEQDNKETAKYINTPQTLLYDKSNILYGLNNAKLSVRKNNQCVLTEGYTDVIMAHQAGFENTAAVSGTALTQKHLNILKRYSDNLIMAFDMDLAGDTATKRGINMAESLGFNIKVVSSYRKGLPAGRQAKDPADIISENPENWKSLVLESKAIMDYYFDSAFSSNDKNLPEGKKQIGRIILPAIRRMQSKIEQSHWAQKLAEKLGVSEGAVLEELKNKSVIPGLTRNPESVHEPLDSRFRGNDSIVRNDVTGRKKLLENKIIALAIKSPEDLNLIEEEHLNLFADGSKTFLDELKKTQGQGAGFTEIFQKPEYKDFFDSAALLADEEPSQDACQELKLCLFELKGIELRNSLNNILSQIKQESNEEKKQELVKKFEEVAKQLHQRS